MTETLEDLVGWLEDSVLSALERNEAAPAVSLIDQDEASIRDVVFNHEDLSPESRLDLAKVLRLFFVADIINQQDHERCERDEGFEVCPGHAIASYEEWSLHLAGLAQMLVNDHRRQEARS